MLDVDIVCAYCLKWRIILVPIVALYFPPTQTCRHEELGSLLGGWVYKNHGLLESLLVLLHAAMWEHVEIRDILRCSVIHVFCTCKSRLAWPCIQSTFWSTSRHPLEFASFLTSSVFVYFGTFASSCQVHVVVVSICACILKRSHWFLKIRINNFLCSHVVSCRTRLCNPAIYCPS